MVAGAIAEIVGKRIAAIVVKEGERPDWQVFLLFTDGTSYEMYGFGGLACAKGLDSADLDRVRDYMKGRHRVVLEATEPQPLEPEFRESLRQEFNGGAEFVLRMVAPNPDGGLVSGEFLRAMDLHWEAKVVERQKVDDRYYARFSRLTIKELETAIYFILKGCRGVLGGLFSSGFSATFANRLLERFVESMLYMMAVGMVIFDEDGDVYFWPVEGAPPGPLRERAIITQIRRVSDRAEAVWLSIQHGVN